MDGNGPTTSMPLIDREHERARLEELLAAGSPKLVLLFGRRRVGKTYLLTALWPREQAFYFTASDTSGVQNRAALVAEFAAWSGQTLAAADYPTWRTAFRMLLDYDRAEPTVLVLDEFQYLGGDVAGIAAVASELNAAWEARRPKRPRLLVLAGSAVRTMEALDDAAAPLHGRFDWKRRIAPFDYWDAGLMVPYPDLEDRAAVFGIFGGMPRYLVEVDRRQSVAANVARLMMAPDGVVRGQVETVLLQEQGLRDTASYGAILRAIADGRTTLNEIAQLAGLTDDKGFRQKVARLVDLELVCQRRNVGAGKTTPFRYHLADPALRFYYRFVAPIQATLARQDPRAAWRESVRPHLDAYLGHLFEVIAEQAYFRKQPAMGLPVVVEWGRWEGQDRQRRSLKIDIVAPLADGRVMTGGIKWNRSPLGAQWLHHHEAMLTRLLHVGVPWAARAAKPDAPLIFIAAGGFEPGFRAAAAAIRSDIVLWDLKDLYPPDPKRPQGR